MRWKYIIMKYKTKKNVLTILILMCILFYFLYSEEEQQVYHQSSIKNNDLSTFIIGDFQELLHYEDNKDFSFSKQKDLKCKMPVLNPYDPSVSKYFYSVPKLNCSNNKDWVYVHNGTLCMSIDVWVRESGFKCDCYPIIRVDDFSNKEVDPQYNFKNRTKMRTDVVRIYCYSTKGNTFQKVLTGVAYNEQLHKPFQNKFDVKRKMDLNVLFFGFDSVSRMTAIRKLSKSRKYVLDELKGLELEGYNVVGDGTPQAFIPILTGTTEIELPEARRGFSNAKTVDGYPFIWKDFKKAGYVTQFVEDQPKLNMFTHRLLGLRDQPTDHYGRPYYIASESKIELYFTFLRDYINSFVKFFTGSKLVDPSFCYGSEKKHNIFLKMLEDVFDMYPNKRKFVVGFHGEISHNFANEISFLDEGVYFFLKRLQSKGYLNDTVLIYMSDHGARFNKFRSTAQGKLEERMPFFSFTFPEWFEQAYPDAMRNFKTNTKRLVTPFDIHATMVHMLNYDGTVMGDIRNRGISLFREIPKSRSCDDAFVEPHWCACLEWQDIEPDDPMLKRALYVAISSLNDWLMPASHFCHFLRVKKITRTKKYHANSNMLKFKQSADHHGRVADLSSKTKYHEVFYQLTIITEPGNGLFEVTVRHNLKVDLMTTTPLDVSRTNAYGKDPECILGLFSHLERFCKCKK